MVERRAPDADLSDGLASDGPDGPDGDGRDDKLAAALAAVFEMSTEDPPEDEAPSPAPSPDWAPPASADWAAAPWPDWAPAAASSEGTVAAGDESGGEPGGDAEEWSWWAADPDGGQEQSPSSEPERSAAALQEAGFGGPLHSALGELGRIIPERGVEAAPAEERTAVPAAGPLLDEGAAAGYPRAPTRRPEWLSADGLRHIWLVHRRDWGPALVVAALVVVAFVVVLSAGGRDTTSSRLDTRSDSTSVPTTAGAVPTTLFEEIPPPEVPVDPGAAGPVDGSVDPSEPAAAPRRARSARAPVTSPPARQARPRSGGAPAPAAPATPAEPPADDPSPPPSSPPPQPTVPSTTAPTIPPPDSGNPCAALPEPQRSRCEEARNRP